MMPGSCRRLGGDGAAEILECEFLTLDGHTFSLSVQLNWTVARLKHEIKDLAGIPCYAQIISDADGRLQNKSLLRDAFMKQGCGDSRFSLFLQRVDYGAQYQLSESQVQRVWEVFHINSHDCGDTIPWSSLRGVCRYLNCHMDELEPGDCGQLSFDTLLRLIADRTKAHRPFVSVDEALDPEWLDDSLIDIEALFVKLAELRARTQRLKRHGRDTRRSQQTNLTDPRLGVISL
eukprot:TRINITY_DN32033_c0_g1_i1.p1 TRINITY_DN32033_c0_g1~~TRINITY_DN32033_c0_g1_i1.p1  ORF type:complete len:233 (-),score=23.95 TRINITY_DN32033_c0_g1_i1:98-796(-)